MKKILILSILCIGFSSMVFSQDCNGNGYAKSRYSDISFEGIAHFYLDELLALENLLSTAPPPGLEDALSDFTSIILNAMHDVELQDKYIAENGLNCFCLRLCPEEVERLTPQEQSEYWTHITYMEQNFTFTPQEVDLLKGHISNLMPYSSKELFVSEDNLLQYLGLANLLSYTKFEMFRDMTGFCSVADYAVILGEPKFYPMRYARENLDGLTSSPGDGENQGLGARASIKRLQDFAYCNAPTLDDPGNNDSFFSNGNNSNTFNAHNGLSVDVNNDQFSKSINLTVSNNNTEYKTYSVSMMDLSGNTINAIATDAVIGGSLQDSYQVSSANLSSGLYFITIFTENKAKTKKLMIFNN